MKKFTLLVTPELEKRVRKFGLDHCKNSYNHKSGHGMNSVIRKLIQMGLKANGDNDKAKR